MMMKTVFAKMMVLTVLGSALAACSSADGGKRRQARVQFSQPETVQLKEASRQERQENAVKIKTELAIEYMRSRDYRSATATIEEALKIDPKYAVAWLVRAQIYQFLKVYDKTKESFQRAFALTPNSAELNNNYGWFLCDALKQPNQALPYFDKALADPTYPTPETANLNKGICSSRMKQHNLADAYFLRALAMSPDFLPAIKERARNKLDMGDIAEADRLFRQYQSQINPLLPDDLLLGWRIAKAQDESQAAYEYEAQLRANFPYSDELQSITTGSSQ
ncbi:type IV pilus biogenesis/stability protein PilW [Alysiella filiformis]|nr:type IV pilus biogenesis/stability protein PilW [Alysiella filiformis]UBQ56157.1 type IV pilus biogenesis/stability protein PilW [Alysiella filiformis DSM 16848]